MKQTVIIILIVTLTLIWSISIPMLVFGEDSVSIEEVKKPLWAVEGVDAYEQLTYSGYQIVNSNVNLGQPGDYLVTYQAVDGTLVKKPVTVFPKDKNEYFLENAFVPEENPTYYDELYASCMIDEKTYAYAYKYHERNPQFPPHNVFINIMEENTLKYSLLLYYNTFTEVTQMIYDSGFLVGTGRYRTIKGEWVLWMFRVNLETRKIDRIELSTKGEVKGMDLVASNNSYFLAGWTTSNETPFDLGRKGKDAFLAQVDKSSLSLKMVKTYPLEGDDLFSHVVLKDNFLYLTQNYNPFPDGTYAQFKTVKIDFLGNIISEIKYQHPYQSIPLNFLKTGDKIYLLVRYFHYANQSFKETLYQVEADLTFEVADGFKNLEKNVVDIYVTDNGFLGYLTINNNQPFIHYKQLGQETDLTCYQLKTENIRNPQFVNGGYRYIIANNPEILQTAVVQIDYLKIDSWGCEEVTERGPKHDYQAMLNLETICHDETQSKLPESLALFGTYPGYYVFTHDMVQLVVGRNWVVLPSVSVENNQVYDVGVKIEFNGLGKLNGEETVSGIRLNQTGDYILELTGKDGQVISKKFTVAQISLQAGISEPQEKPDTKVTVAETDTEEARFDFIKNVDNAGNFLTTSESDWVWLLPLSALIAGAVFVARMKR
ncbi:MAG TPA: hypothetical protein GXZ57_01915 [Acholeplasmataceae bacterium]|nr:hypothetical protein [Acholeplasmataceae bacterium]